MLQIAIISDVHANILALKEVLNDIQNRSIDQIYCLGDLVDFAPWGNEVVAKIQEMGIPCLLGNHDQRIAFNEPIVPLSIMMNKKLLIERLLSTTAKNKLLLEIKSGWLRYPIIWSLLIGSKR